MGVIYEEYLIRPYREIRQSLVKKGSEFSVERISFMRLVDKK